MKIGDNCDFCSYASIKIVLGFNLGLSCIISVYIWNTVNIVSYKLFMIGCNGTVLEWYKHTNALRFIMYISSFCMKKR